MHIAHVNVKGDPINELLLKKHLEFV